MSETMRQRLETLLPQDCMQDINAWVAKYPADQKQSAVMAALRIAQEHHGFLTTQLMDAIADYLDMPAIAVYEVATFYTMYACKPQGRHQVNVCTNISCKLGGCATIVNCLEDKLQIKLGETTADNRFTLKAVECLGACVGAPMMQIDKDYHEYLNADKLDAILEQYP